MHQVPMSILSPPLAFSCSNEPKMTSALTDSHQQVVPKDFVTVVLWQIKLIEACMRRR